MDSPRLVERLFTLRLFICETIYDFLINKHFDISANIFSYLNWMHNKNIKDEVKRTLEHKACIGKYPY